MGGGGEQQLQCKSDSAQYSMVSVQQSPCEEDGGGLKFAKKKLEKQ